MATEANAERYVAPDGRTYITGQPPPFRGPRNSLTDAGNGRGNQVVRALIAKGHGFRPL